MDWFLQHEEWLPLDPNRYQQQTVAEIWVQKTQKKLEGWQEPVISPAIFAPW